MLMSFTGLYPYQNIAVDSAIDALFNKNKSAVIESLPTGAGKTIIFSAFTRKVIEESNERGLILVHRDQLLKQSIQKLKYVWPSVSHGIIKGPIRQFDQQVSVASVQTLTNHLDEYLDSFKKYGVPKVCVIDEAHHSLAPEWISIILALREAGVKILGVTATPMRTKKDENLTDIFEEMPFSISIFQLIREGFLSEIEPYRFPTDLDIESCIGKDGEYNTVKLAKKVNQDKFNAQVIEAWEKVAKDRKTICFAVDIEHVNALVDRYRSAGARAIGIHGTMPKKEQERIINGYAVGEYNVLVNCELLTEGYDEQSISAVQLARPTTSRILYCQMIGRGLRTFPGKKDCVVIDMVSNTSHGMVTINDLLEFYGYKHAGKLYKKGIKDEYGLNKQMRISAETMPWLDNAERYGAEYASALDQHKIKVFNVDEFPWIEMNGSYYVSARNDLSLAVYKHGNEYITYLIFSEKENKAIAQLCDQPVERSFALDIANVYLYDFGKKNLIAKAAQWRDQKPSDGQQALLKSTMETHKAKYGEPKFTEDPLPENKGKYSEALTAILGSLEIKNKYTRRINRDEAIERLRKMVIEEKKTEDLAAGEMDVEGNAPVLLTISGDYTTADQKAMENLVSDLRKDQYGGYPSKFLMDNQISIDGSYVRVISDRQLTEKQYNFLKDKINSIFRVHFREKAFVIEAEIKKTEFQEKGV